MNKAQTPPIPASLSTIGRTVDASRQLQASKRGPHSSSGSGKPRIVLQPWDGVELAGLVLDEARARSMDPRHHALLSSPRVNPLLVSKAATESAIAKAAGFLHAVAAADIPQLAASRTPSPTPSAEACRPPLTAATTTSASTRQVRRLRAKPSPAFLAPPRPGPADDPRGPSVGKYFPRFTCIERRSATPALPRAGLRSPKGDRSRPRSPGTPQSVHGSPASLSGTRRSGSGCGSGDALAASLNSGSSSGRGRSAGGRRHATLPPAVSTRHMPAVTPDPTDYRRHAVRDVSSAFKSRLPRSLELPLHDLSYWPLPLPGGATYHAGGFHGNARERSYEPGGAACGARVDYAVRDDAVRPRHSSLLDFSRHVARGAAKTRLLFGGVDTSQLAYNVANVDALSTKPRAAPGVVPLARQSAPRQQPPRTAAPGDGLGVYANSVLTRPKRGFVDIRRMHVTRGVEYDDGDDGGGGGGGGGSRQALPVDYSTVERRSPRAVILRSSASGHADVTASGGAGARAVAYNADDSSIRRHRPAAFMPRTQRAPVASPGAACDTSYVLRDDRHVPSSDFERQISRDARERKYTAK